MTIPINAHTAVYQSSKIRFEKSEVELPAPDDGELIDRDQLLRLTVRIWKSAIDFLSDVGDKYPFEFARFQQLPAR